MTAGPALFIGWPIIIKQLDQYKIILGEWGLTPDHFTPQEELMNARKSGIGFEIDLNLINKLERCIAPIESGFMPAVTKKWIDTINSEIIATFAICTKDGHPVVMGQESAREWLNPTV